MAKVVQTDYENLRVAMRNLGKSKNGSACSPSVILVCAHLEDDGNSHKAFDLSCAKICLYSQKSIQSFVSFCSTVLDPSNKTVFLLHVLNTFL